MSFRLAISHGYWGMEGPEYLAWIKEDEESEHIALMGATTYREMSGYAVDMPDDPGLAAMTETPKVVFSSTLEGPPSWANTELVDGDAVEVVRDMKRRDPRPCGRSAVSVCAGPCSKPASWTASVLSSSQSSPAPPGRTASSRVSRHRPRPGRQPHVRRSAPVCSSTFPPCSTGRQIQRDRLVRAKDGPGRARRRPCPHRRETDHGVVRARGGYAGGSGPRAGDHRVRGHTFDWVN